MLLIYFALHIYVTAKNQKMIKRLGILPYNHSNVLMCLRVNKNTRPTFDPTSQIVFHITKRLSKFFFDFIPFEQYNLRARYLCYHMIKLQKFAQLFTELVIWHYAFIVQFSNLLYIHKVIRCLVFTSTTNIQLSKIVAWGCLHL